MLTHRPSLVSAPAAPCTVEISVRATVSGAWARSKRASMTSGSGFGGQICTISKKIAAPMAQPISVSPIIAALAFHETTLSAAASLAWVG